MKSSENGVLSMGGSSDNEAADKTNQLMEEEIDQNKQELYFKQEAMTQRQMDIEKAAGGQNWSPTVLIPNKTQAIDPSNPNDIPFQDLPRPGNLKGYG